MSLNLILLISEEMLADMKVHNLVRTLILVLIAFALLSCGGSRLNSPSPDAPSNFVTQPALVIRSTDSPTNGDSREPELTATRDGRIILSWVEKIGEKRYALRAAIRDDQGWSQPNTVAQGENWFVNWADFPSVIALDDGSLAAHWLVKSGSGTYATTLTLLVPKTVVKPGANQ